MKKVPSIIPLSAIVVILAMAVTYGIGFLIRLPLPFVNDGVYHVDYTKQNNLMNAWANVRIYNKTQPVEEVKTTPENTTNDNGDTNDSIVVNNQGELDLTKFSEIDESSFNDYIESHKEVMANGFIGLVIDSLVKDNKATGIKTKQGDDVLAIDVPNNILIIGTKVEGQNAKVAILKNSKQLDLSVVENLIYWETIDKHLAREGGILGINASSYTWNKTGNYGTLYGVAKRHGDLIRRPQNLQLVTGFTVDGKMQIGTDIAGLHNAIEASSVLIKDSNQAFNSKDTSKLARTAIGQTANGDIIFMVVDGDDKSVGSTLSSVAGTLSKYGAINAAALSDGVCTTMYWKGKIVNTPCSNNAGVKLPSVWVVKASK